LSQVGLSRIAVKPLNLECLLARRNFNPLEVIEQIIYLLFLHRLDDLHTQEENKSVRLKKPLEWRIFPEGEAEIYCRAGLISCD